MAQNNSDNKNFSNIQISTNTISSTNTNGNVIYAPNGSGNIKFNNGTNDTFIMDSNGMLTMPKQACFLAYRSTDLTGANPVTVIFDTVVFDQGSNYNNSTGIFTAPVTGIYFFASHTATTYNNTDMEITVGASTSYSGNTIGNFAGTNGYFYTYSSCMISLSATNTVKIRSYITSSFVVKGSSSPYVSYFCGYLMC